MAGLRVSEAYLAIYNAVLAIGWLVILGQTVQQFLVGPEGSRHIGVYAKVELYLKIFQTAAVMEVVHCAIGLVCSSVVLTAFQVASRVFLTWCIVHSVPQVQDNIGVGAFLIAWSITEVIRYSFYVCSIAHSVPYILQWCRYTFFIVLYPIGVTGELLTIYASLPYVRRSGVYSVSLPNKANFSFSYYHFLLFTMLLYIPVFPQLYFHMFGQRKKVLGGQGVKSKKVS